ncbi:MAG: hypothetical protein ABR915_07405, partial [Thermoguttaceae bacterium]
LKHWPETKTPTSLADYYRLAQQHEREGRPSEALTAYEQGLAMNEELLDPPAAYLQLLKAQAGPETAAARFRKTCEPFPDNLSYALVALRLLRGEAQRLALEEFRGKHETFVPVYLELADCYSAQEMPNRSKIAEARECHYLEQVLAIAEREDLGRYYLDKSLAAGRLDEARRRLSASKNPPLMGNVRLIQFHPPGLIYVVDPCATKILYSLGWEGWKEGDRFRIQGGAMQWAAAGLTKEDMQRLLETASSSKAKLRVKYVDTRGLESEVAEFTPTAAEFEPPVKVPKFNLPNMPKIKLPDMPGLPERQRQELEDIRRRLEKESPGNRTSE